MRFFSRRILVSCLCLGLAACDAPASNSSTPEAKAPAADPGEAKVTNRQHLSPMAWGSSQWQESVKGVRTSYNPDADLSDEELTLVPGDPRWLDFVYWSINNKVAEHQVEQYQGTEWDGPAGGVIFHWAPGSHWERDTLASFGFAIGHVAGEHRWLDTMFPRFFEKYGGVYGVNIKDRLVEIDPKSPVPWVELLSHVGSSTSPYYRYLFHQEAVVDAEAEEIHLVGGQGIAFTYTFERYYHELREVLTDARSVDFFRMYDLFGRGFAARGNWAGQNPPAKALEEVGYTSTEKEADRKKYDPNPAAVEVPKDLAQAAAMERGKGIYLAQCAVCHGIQGDGSGFLATKFDVLPRDFTKGVYKFRSTATGELPTIKDIERIVRDGVPGTTMPGWGQFLKPEQVTDVSLYLVAFSERFTAAIKDKAEPKMLEVPASPKELDTLVARGEKVWRKMKCASCHGKGGQGNGPSAPGLKDDWGQAIKATDLTYKWSFRNGFRPEDIYRTMIGGLNGTPMPSYAEALPKEEDRWAMVAHILSLSPAERPAMKLADYDTKHIGPNGRVKAKEDR